MIPLSFTQRGHYKIIKVIGGRGISSRLENLGIREGDYIDVITNSNGPIFIKKEGTKIGIGFGMASKIYVEQYK